MRGLNPVAIRAGIAHVYYSEANWSVYMLVQIVRKQLEGERAVEFAVRQDALLKLSPFAWTHTSEHRSRVFEQQKFIYSSEVIQFSAYSAVIRLSEQTERDSSHKTIIVIFGKIVDFISAKVMCHANDDLLGFMG